MFHVELTDGSAVVSPALLGLGITVASHARAPVVAVLDDRETVRAAIEIDVDAAIATALIKNHDEKAFASGKLDMRIEPVRQEGGCEVLKWTIPHPLKTVSYTARSCESKGGILVRLVESDDFAQYDSEWRVEPAGEGRSRLIVHLRSIPAFPIPGVVVRAQVKASLTRSLSNIKASLEAGPRH